MVLVAFLCDRCSFSSAMVYGFVDSWLGFLAKWLKVGLVKMAKKWLENLVMEIILFNTRFLRVPKIWLWRVVKKSALRLKRANLAKF